MKDHGFELAGEGRLRTVVRLRKSLWLLQKKSKTYEGIDGRHVKTVRRFRETERVQPRAADSLEYDYDVPLARNRESLLAVDGEVVVSPKNFSL